MKKSLYFAITIFIILAALQASAKDDVVIKNIKGSAFGSSYKITTEISEFTDKPNLSSPYKKKPAKLDPDIIEDEKFKALGTPYPKIPVEIPKDNKDKKLGEVYREPYKEAIEYKSNAGLAIPYKKQISVIEPDPLKDRLGVPYSKKKYETEEEAIKEYGDIRPLGATYTIQSDVQKKAEAQGHGL